jgi:hypothetical protein
MPACRRLAITYGTRARFLREWLLRPQMPLPAAAVIDARPARQRQTGHAARDKLVLVRPDAYRTQHR